MALEERAEGSAALPTPSIITNVSGVDFISIPLSHYLNLMERTVEGCRTSSVTGPVSMAQLAAHAGSPIYLDHEVADFLYAEVGRLTIDQARTACRERFGDSRTPSRSAINRYWLRVRQGLDRHGHGGKE